MVQIVELPHDGVSGLSHLDKDSSGEGEIGLRIKASGESVHLPTPGPEAAAFGVRPAPEGAMEGVAVAIGKTRKRNAIENLLTGKRFEADPNAREARVLHIKADACQATLRQPGVRGPVRAHCSDPARSVSTVANAATPARQSSGSAHSAGE